MVEATGRTREEAVAKAAARLGIAVEEVEVTLVEVRRRRFLGLFGGPLVRVRVCAGRGGIGIRGGATTGRPELADAERTREIVRSILAAMGVTAAVSVEDRNGSPAVQVRTVGADGLLIGRRGQTLLALEHVAYRILTRARDDRPVVPVDVGGYRARGGRPVEETEAPNPPKARRRRGAARRRPAAARAS